MTERIDLFPHVYPARYLDRIEGLRRPGLRIPDARALYDLDERFRIMDAFEGYVQVLTLCSPPIEEIATGDAAVDLAQLANDSLAELVTRHPDRFVGFAASVALTDVDAATREVDRAIGELGALGVQIFTNVLGHPLDEPRFAPFFARMAELDRPIWVHPARGGDVPDYAREDRSRYWIHVKLGWPYETAAFATRVILSGVLDRHPRLRILTHHGGGLIPHLAGRLTLGHDAPESRALIGVDDSFTPERVLASYRALYGDTAFSGTLATLSCALAFFGSEHLVFGTDMPFGPEGGRAFVRESIAAVGTLPPEQQGNILRDTPRRFLRGA